MLHAMLVRAGRSAIAALRRPWVSATLFTMLLLDSCTLPPATTFGRYAITPRCRCCCRLRPMAMVVQETSGLTLIDDYDEAAAGVDEQSIVARLYCQPRRRVSGIWAATRAWWDPTIHVVPLSRDLTGSELAMLRPDFAGIVERRGHSSLEEYPHLMRSGSSCVSRIIWGGYLHNTISAGLAISMFISFGWVTDRVRTRRARRALLAGLCPTCRYDLRGQAEYGCPECGWRREVVDQSTAVTTRCANGRMHPDGGAPG